MRFNSGLCEQYSNCEAFFRDILKINSVATLEHVIVDLEELAQTRDIDIIREHVMPIILRIPTLLQRSNDDGTRSLSEVSLTNDRLRKPKVYPIVTAGGKASELVSGQEFTSGNLLFIPDQSDLYKLFRDKVRLLDFVPNEIRQIRPLIDSFPSARYLSMEVRKGLSHKGTKSFQRATTEDYRQKHRGILR